MLKEALGLFGIIIYELKIKLLNNWAKESRQMQKIKAINVNSITWTPCDIAHVGQRYYDALAKIQKLRCHIHRNE